MLLRSRKIVIADGGVQNKVIRKRKDKEKRKKHPFQHLPEEFILENVLPRLSGLALAKCSLISKLWHNSIYNDKRFATAHFAQNQNKLSLFFSLLNCSNLKDNAEDACFFSLEKKSKKDHVFDLACRNLVKFQLKNEPVGYCNGLACVKIASEHVGAVGAISVINPTRAETLVITYLPPNEEEGSRCIPLCHGFGFDSSSQEYKVVLIFTSTTNNEFLCMLFTLGTNSWRKITTATARIPPPPGSSPFPTRMVTRVLENNCPSTSAILCGGDLFWRVTNQVQEEDDDNKTEMLLSFDLHKEKIKFVRLPTESTLTQTMNEHEYLVADQQLLEFKGYPCIARFEKIMNSNSDHRCNDLSSCCKMQLFVLKDKVKQEWVKGETFDVQIKHQEGIPPGFCCYFNPTTVTCVLAFYDHLLLYWFDGDCLTFYNLQTKHLEVVRGSRSYPALFPTKMKASKPAKVVGSDDNTFCPYMDYQLVAQVENLHSLKTFIPEGEVSIRNCLDDLKQLVLEKLPAGWVTTGRQLEKGVDVSGWNEITVRREFGVASVKFHALICLW